jgi:hypothetical protein
VTQNPIHLAQSASRTSGGGGDDIEHRRARRLLGEPSWAMLSSEMKESAGLESSAIPGGTTSSEVPGGNTSSEVSEGTTSSEVPEGTRGRKYHQFVDDPTMKQYWEEMESAYRTEQKPKLGVVKTVKDRIKELERILDKRGRPLGDLGAQESMKNELIQRKGWLDTYGKIVGQDLHS